jgi:hypothetical protein
MDCGGRAYFIIFSFARAFWIRSPSVGGGSEEDQGVESSLHIEMGTKSARTQKREKGGSSTHSSKGFDEDSFLDMAVQKQPRKEGEGRRRSPLPPNQPSSSP